MSERFACPDCHVSYPAPEPRTFSFNSPMGACPTCDGSGTDPSPRPESKPRGEEAIPAECRLADREVTPETRPARNAYGARLSKREPALLGSRQEISPSFRSPPFRSFSRFFRDLMASPNAKMHCSDRIPEEIEERLRFLNEVGVTYLSLARRPVPSGGEAQRIRLPPRSEARSSRRVYVLDEPEIGLHQRDNARLISTLNRLPRPRQHRPRRRA